MLDPVRRTRGVRGALVVSREDGLVVASDLSPGVNGPAVAALSASLSRRADGLAAATGRPVPVSFELGGTEGSLLMAPGPEGLLVVAITSPETDREEVRRRLLLVAEEAG